MVAISYCKNTVENNNWCKSKEETNIWLKTHPFFFLTLETLVQREMFEGPDGDVENYFPLVSHRKIIELNHIIIDPQVTKDTILQTNIYFSEEKISVNDDPWQIFDYVRSKSFLNIDEVFKTTFYRKSARGVDFDHDLIFKQFSFQVSE